MRYMTAAALVLVLAAPAFAQSTRNASDASGQTSLAAGAIGESGLRATSGVVAIPLGVAALASGVVGVGAAASGQQEAAGGFSAAASGAAHGARELVNFSTAPLTITNEVVVAKPQLRPQPAPHVPYSPQ